jgi:hypothetical protein
MYGLRDQLLARAALALHHLECTYTVWALKLNSCEKNSWKSAVDQWPCGFVPGP